MNRFLHRERFLRWLEQEPIVATMAGLARDSAVYLTGGLLVGLGNVILIPLYTRTLAPREFGIFVLIDVAILLVVTVTTLKMDVSYLKWFADIGPSRRGELLGSTLLTGLSASALGGTILTVAAMSPLGEHWFHIPVPVIAWLFLPIVVFENAYALLLTDLRARRRAGLYSIAAIIRLAGLLLASYYLMVFRNMGLPGLFLGRLIADLISAGFLSAICLRSVTWRISRAVIGPMLTFGLPLIWSIFAVMLQDASGRYFLIHYGTLEQVGLLGAAIKISAVFQMLVSLPFGVAWGGMLFQIAKEQDARAIYSRIFAYVFALAIGMALVLTILGPTLFRMFTAPSYYAAIAALPFVLLVRAFSVIEQPSATGIYLSGETRLFALAYTVALCVDLLLLYVLVPRYGVIGVGWAWLLSTALVPAMNLLFGQFRYRLRFNWKLILLPAALWIPFLLRPANMLPIRLWNHIAFQCGIGAAIVSGIGLLIIHDIRQLRRRIAVHSFETIAVNRGVD